MENVIIARHHVKFRMGNYTSFLSAGKFHGKIPSFPQQTNSMAKFHHFPQGVKTSTKIKKDIISFHPSK